MLDEGRKIDQGNGFSGTAERNRVIKKRMRKKRRKWESELRQIDDR